jgi:aminopeptidase 2
MASRLPTTCKPIHYDLVVRTDLELDRPRFDGFVKITLKVLETTSTIVLSAAPSLTVGLASFVSTDIEHEAEQYDAYRSYDTSLERITFHFAHFLEAGSTIIFTLGFNGFLLPAMDGYYFSTCIIDGKPVHYSSTSFAVCALWCTLLSC